MHLYTEKLEKRLEAYLQPLTKNMGRIYPYSPARANILDSTLKLWSYLQAVGGEWETIRPAIGAAADRRLHNAFDEDGSQLNLDKHTEKKVVWILSPGLIYTQSCLDGPVRVFTIRAHVVAR